MKLSILIPTIQRHAALLNRLKVELMSQIKGDDLVEILIDDSETDAIGKKRNRLLARARGKYLCFFDSDDYPSPNYIFLLMKAIESDCDCASLRGLYSVDGKTDGIFEHSLKYTEWKTNPEGQEVKYVRTPNHLSMIRSDVAKRFKFPETSFGEDHVWSKAIYESGLLKKEYYIEEVIYHYRYITNKMKYSQGEEENFILDVFADKPNGKFIDIGAYDVYKFSNTRRLYELGGWSGCLVEAAPTNYKAIADHYAKDSRMTVLNVAIGETSGEIDFYESNGDAVSTTDEAHMRKWENGGVKFTKIKVQQVGVAAFMKEYCKDIDFISIDTEATNMVIFRNIPDFVWEQITLLCIEHDNCQEEIEEKLSDFGFSTLYVNAENIIMAKI